MSHASGPAIEGLLPGSFTHAASGVSYRIFERDGKAWLSYRRDDSNRQLQGEQELSWFIGSGKRGRTYLFSREGYWFESPVNWYTKKQVWDMNPKSMDAKELPMTLPVDSTCLHCHASGAQPSLPGARNHFANDPFQHGGVGCESCHGDTTAHVDSHGTAPVVNPGKLTPSRRDSVCLQCHLEGQVAVDEPGRSLQMFRPGDELGEDVRFFANANAAGANSRATSQWEALLRSACKRKSGDALTCTSCHDPHGSPRPEERVAYYRAKCVACHSDAAFVARHHPEQQDCTACHMARVSTSDVAHEQVTDHRIPRHPNAPDVTFATAEAERLALIGGGKASDRDLGLAYAQLALRGDAAAAQQAILLLDTAAGHGNSQRDAELHTQLGLLYQEGHDNKAAQREYEDALAADPASSIAAGNLAILEATEHNLPRALQLWRRVQQEDPAQLAAGFNLAIGECMAGNRDAAMEALQRLLLFSPDEAKARQFFEQLSENTQACSASRH
ncbi:cytochrome c3 family protein [Silvibacterium acidisoli]|uniref:cytochrome c3 family protein n=1 Tax=Acidobacteriaceae bacterium ZG23-2 TaxID=2883246 RepID=UPI00406C073A